MRTERLLSRLRRFINAMEATIVRSSSARTVFVSSEDDRFFRSSFIGSLFRFSLVPTGTRCRRLLVKQSVAVRLQCGKLFQIMNSNDISNLELLPAYDPGCRENSTVIFDPGAAAPYISAQRWFGLKCFFSLWP